MGLEEVKEEPITQKEVRIPTYIGNIGCTNDANVYMEIHIEVDKQPALLTLTMTSTKAEEVHKTIRKAIKKGLAWQQTGVPPG